MLGQTYTGGSQLDNKIKKELYSQQIDAGFYASVLSMYTKTLSKQQAALPFGDPRKLLIAHLSQDLANKIITTFDFQTPSLKVRTTSAKLFMAKPPMKPRGHMAQKVKSVAMFVQQPPSPPKQMAMAQARQPYFATPQPKKRMAAID